MPGASRKGIDSAGGTIIDGSDNVIVNDAGSVRLGDTVEDHGRGEHDSANMAEGSSTVIINDRPAVRAGNQASCGHGASGSDNVVID